VASDALMDALDITGNLMVEALSAPFDEITSF
jgi:hypothetical protein